MLPGGSSSRRGRVALIVLAAGYATVALLASVPASPLVPVLPKGVEAPSWLARAATALGLGGLAVAALTAAALAVLAVLTAAFVVAVLEALRGRLSVSAAAAAGAVSLALALAAPVLLSRDVTSYAVYGRLASVHGLNPYATVPAEVRDDPFSPAVSDAWRRTPSLYGPVFTLSAAAVTGVARAPAATVLGFKLLAAVAAAVAAAFAAAAAHRSSPGTAPLALTLVALNPVVVIHTVGGAHNDALVAAALSVAALLAVRPASASGPRPAAGARALAVTGLLTLAALVKYPAGLALAMWLWWIATGGRGPDRQRQERIIGTAPAVRHGLAAAVPHAALAFGLALVATVPAFGLAPLRAAATLGSVSGWASPVRLVARGAAEAASRLAGPAAGRVAADIVAAGFLALFVLAVAALLRRGAGGRPGGWAAGLLVLSLCIPYLLPWYAAWWLPLLPLAAGRPPAAGSGPAAAPPLAAGSGPAAAPEPAAGPALIVGGTVASAVLALTGVPAEPSLAPGLWDAMVLAVNYVAAPLELGVLALVIRALFWEHRKDGPRWSRRAAPSRGPSGSGP